MAFVCIRRLCSRQKLIYEQFYKSRVFSTKPVALRICSHKLSLYQKPFMTSLSSRCIVVRCVSSNGNKENGICMEPERHKKLSLIQRFKKMYRDYWYVLLPVHVVTSVGWFGLFYYAAKSGLDVVGILQTLNVSEKIINPLKDSSLGYIAISYTLYKIATPLRYTVTLGGTTISINYLRQWGYIKPVPTTEQLKVIYKEKKDNILESMRETKNIYKEKKENIMETVRETKEELKLRTDQLKDCKQSIVEDLGKKLKDSKEQLQTQKEQLFGTDIKKIKNSK